MVCQRPRYHRSSAWYSSGCIRFTCEAAEINDPVIMLEHIGLYGLRGGLTGWGQNINQKVDTKSVNDAIAEINRTKSARQKLLEVAGMSRLLHGEQCCTLPSNLLSYWQGRY